MYVKCSADEVYHLPVRSSWIFTAQCRPYTTVLHIVATLQLAKLPTRTNGKIDDNLTCGEKAASPTLVLSRVSQLRHLSALSSLSLVPSRGHRSETTGALYRHFFNDPRLSQSWSILRRLIKYGSAALLRRGLNVFRPIAREEFLRERLPKREREKKWRIGDDANVRVCCHKHLSFQLNCIVQ